MGKRSETSRPTIIFTRAFSVTSLRRTCPTVLPSRSTVATSHRENTSCSRWLT
ncbi:MAG: hypothetical protein ACYC8T_07320 [Myxococcaceae bacterium]